MGELLKAVLETQSNSQRTKCYVAETGYVSQSTLSGITTDLIITVQDDTLFLCQSFGLMYASVAANNTLRAQRVQTDIQLQIQDLATKKKYFSGGISGNSSIQACQMFPSMNDRADLGEYFLFAGSDMIQVSFNSLWTAQNGQSLNVGVMFVGVEYKFTQPVDVTILEKMALNYTPPIKDQARSISLDPINGVQGSIGPPNVSKNVTQSKAKIAAMQTALQQVATVPQTSELGHYNRYLRHQINREKASIQAANATK